MSESGIVKIRGRGGGKTMLYVLFV
jgi:hypothetical protein